MRNFMQNNWFLTFETQNHVLISQLTSIKNINYGGQYCSLYLTFIENSGCKELLYKVLFWIEHLNLNFPIEKRRIRAGW